MYRFLATTLEDNYDQNDNLLEELYRTFTVAAGMLGAEVILLGALQGVRLKPHA